MKRKLYRGSQEKLALFNELVNSVNNLGFPIIVEGKRDKIALEKLDFNVPIIKLNDGQSILSTVETLSNITGDSREFIILTDWDKTGKSLLHKLQKFGESVDLVPNILFWNILRNLFSKEISCIEDLPSIINLLSKNP